MSASLGLWWCQHMIVKGLHRHCIQVVIVTAYQQKLLALRRSILIPRIKLCPSDLTIVFKLCRRQLPPKLHLLWHLVRLKDKCLIMLEYIYPCPPPHGQLYMAFAWASSFDSVAVAVIEVDQQHIHILLMLDIAYWEVLWGFKYINKSLLIKYFIVSM
jgi:hypothetical protein